MKILIVEDEPIIARRIQRMLQAELGQSIENVAIRHSVESGLAFLVSSEIDVLFLDLNLNGEDGFDLLESMVAAPFHTIIISAYKAKAIRAFEYGVLDFIPKPFNHARIAQALQRIKGTSAQVREDAKYLAIQKRGRFLLLETEHLAYIKGAGIYSELHFQDGKKEIHNKNLEKLSQLLSANFDRIHKSYIVNNRLIKEIIVQSGSKYTLVLQDGTSLPMSRIRYKDLRDKWAI